MDIPPLLVDKLQSGQTVLFLGSGASFGAIHPKKISPPLGNQLSDLIARKFLSEEYLGYPLQLVSELAISESDLFSVQSYVYDLFKEFSPSKFHELISTFVWKAIATTNYDLIVERAYEKNSSSLQNPVVFIKNLDRVEEKLREPNSVCYYKLHGCITDINNPDVPLIITPDQYLVARKTRSRLFERIESLAYEYPFIFIGHSLVDSDIRSILLNLSELGTVKPRSYIVTPNMKPAEQRLWESKRYTCIKASFEEFLEALDKKINKKTRILANLQPNEETHPFLKKYCPNDENKISNSLRTFLSRDVEFIFDGITAPKSDPKSFYKGFFIDWSPIIDGLDVKRGLNDTILSEVFLNNEEDRSELVEFFLIKGHAGSGKTISLNRLAYDAAIDFDKICVKLISSDMLNYEAFVEMYKLCKQRIFLFIDPVSNYLDLINKIASKARLDRLPLTIIGAERNNTWNTDCDSIYGLLTDFYQIHYLNQREIDDLIELLYKNNSLGDMKGLEREKQRERLEKKAGRQLLVALHEATLGMQFSDIVFDEYNSIASPEAKSLYLTVCMMHRIGVPTRAGLISRVHQIPFTVFQKELFAPLEFVIFTIKNKRIDDYQYLTRHPVVAKMVFDRVLNNPQDKYDEYIRLLNALDISFSSDREAYFEITKAKNLLDIFKDPQMIRQIYELAKERDYNNIFILQQEAIFEMNSTGGSLYKASSLLNEALKIDPGNKFLSHSISELEFKKADSSKTLLEKQKHLDKAKSIAISLTSSTYPKERPTHTIIKVSLEELSDIIHTDNSTLIERKVKEIQKLLEKAIQLFPDSSFILDSEATFSELLKRHPIAVESLKRAFSLNKRSTYLAGRLATIFENQNEVDKAIDTLKECLDRNPGEKTINYKIAYLLDKYQKGDRADIKYYLRRSFTEGDDNLISQFWYARCLYIEDEIAPSYLIFNKLRNQNIDNRIKQKVRGTISENGSIKTFSGFISRLEASHAFIVLDRTQDRIFAHISNNRNSWANLENGKRINLNLAFNYRGPQAINISLENFKD